MESKTILNQVKTHYKIKMWCDKNGVKSLKWSNNSVRGISRCDLTLGENSCVIQVFSIKALFTMAIFLASTFLGNQQPLTALS